MISGMYLDFKIYDCFQDAWMVVFTELPKMNKLWLEGVLEIDGNDDSYEVTLSATHIIIMVCGYQH